jgi:radical SAM superfamily enzyme YgiQ (UPF0313 family)
MSGRKIVEHIDFLLSKEKGTVYKDPGGKVAICLVYPNVYRIGMSNLGFQGIYTLLNRMGDVVCERAFLPDENYMEEHVRTGTEILSMESKRPLIRFEIVAFTLSFENDYSNIMTILRMSRIPSRKDERKDIHPLLIMGGPCAFYNPEPVAEFFDLCFVGEAEEMLPEFMEIYRKSAGKDELTRRSSEIEGVYVPALYTVTYAPEGKISSRTPKQDAPAVVKRRFIEDISSCPVSPSIVTSETEFSEMYLIEAMRGCPWNCRFCVAGHIYKPPRKKDIDALRGEIEEACSKTRRIGLIGPSLSDYAHVEEALSIEGIDFSIASLRAVPRSYEVIRSLGGCRSISIAVEAGTERLRKAINKGIAEEDIIETSRLILSGGTETLRLYLMVGLPTEGEGDIEGIVSITKKIRSVSGKGNVVLSISIFVPKPFTPFQWHFMEEKSVVKGRLKKIRGDLSHFRGIKVFHDVPKYSYMQGLFSVGDRRVSAVLERMAEGADWQRACTEGGIDAGFYFYRRKGFSEILPWDFIDNGFPKEKLWEEYQEALATQ